jgi:hypothetical protein
VRRPHSGQALVVVLALLGSMVGGLAWVLTTGQLVNDKIRLTNAADAAAYSAALWQARSLNYQAYLNRAIVANEVAIAQLVSLRSWSRFVETGLSQWNNNVLATAQAVAHAQAPLAAASLVEQVVQANEPRAQISRATNLLQAGNGNAWLNQFTTRFQRGGGDTRRLATLLMNSRDGFTRSRRADLPVSLGLVSLPRRGGTDLLGEYSWRGLDSLSLHVDLLFGDVETPLGWGAAEQRQRPVTQQGEHGGSRTRNPRASRQALRQLTASQGYLGIPQIRDLVNPASRAPRTLTYSVALDLPRESIATADRLMPRGIATIEGGSEPVSPLLAANALHALSSAEVYFQRPSARQDRRSELPSLFSPYWQARLVPSAGTVTQSTASFRGISFDPFLALK